MKRILKLFAIAIAGVILGMTLIFISLYLYFSGDYKVLSTVVQDPNLPKITVNGVVLHAEAFGNPKNKTLIVLHGGPGNDYRYLLPLQALSDKYYVVFYDQRGTGLSKRLDAKAHTLEEYIKDLDEIIKIYSPIKKVYLIGHSWGAMLATAYIAKFPDKVEKVVLAEPGFLNPETGKEFLEKTNYMVPAFTWSVVKHTTKIMFQSLHVDGPDDHAPQDFAMSLLLSNPDIEGNPIESYYCNKDLKTASLPYWRGGFVANRTMFRAAMDDRGNIKIDLTKGLENYNGKTLFLNSECNTIIGKETQEKHSKFFKNPETKTIPGAGHTMIGEKPEESLQAIREFLSNK